jgi:NAD-dependent dihydropyrimidine dehydrogenase PreA subunit
MCLVVCPQAVFDLENKKVRIVSRDACMECGACAVNCSAEALIYESGEGCAVAILNEMLGRGCICVSECC